MAVTEKGVQLLAALKPLKRQGWRKVCFILEAGNLGRRADACPKADSPPPTVRAGKSFYRRREGTTGRNSAVRSDSRLETGRSVV